jgi:hypothetical protein
MTLVQMHKRWFAGARRVVLLSGGADSAVGALHSLMTLGRAACAGLTGGPGLAQGAAAPTAGLQGGRYGLRETYIGSNADF